MAWNQSGSERRWGLRQPAHGEVWLRAEGLQVDGRLLDRSGLGFRMAYASGELAIGQEVEYLIGEQQGRARVVWNHFTRRHWECGLLMVV